MRKIEVIMGKSENETKMESWGTDRPKHVCDFCEGLFLHFGMSASTANPLNLDEFVLDSFEHLGGVASLAIEIEHTSYYHVPNFYIYATDSSAGWSLSKRITYCPFCGRNLAQMVADAENDFILEDAIEEGKKIKENVSMWGRLLGGDDIS